MVKKEIKILFIDIDGVLLPLGENGYETRMVDYQFLKKLADNNVYFIISSSWRYDIIELYQWWVEQQGLPMYHGNIDLNTEYNSINSKSKGIYDMIQELLFYYKKNIKFAIIDDENLINRNNKMGKKLSNILEINKGLFIQTDGQKGLTKENRESILNYFNI